jgi:spore coat protein CotH
MKQSNIRHIALAVGFGCAFSVLAQTRENPPGRNAGLPEELPAGTAFDGPAPFGPGGPGGMQQETKLLKRFDTDGDGRLDTAERKAAREFLQKEVASGRGRRAGGGRGGPGGFGGRGENQEPTGPGPKISPSEVKSFSGEALYDPLTLRTFFLEFEDADWEKELAEFKNTDVEVPAKLIVDGKAYPDVGVHMRGMSSFMMIGEGRKRSLNVSLDFVHKDQNISGYRTLNLLNSHEDPSYLRTVLSYQIAREYIPAPKANLARVVINGESWGIYVNAQQFNKDFVKEWFSTSTGARWKAPGSPGGRASLAYLGDDVAAYKRVYEIKSKDDPKSWADLVKLCKVLNETPANELEEALAPILDVDGALKFLALDNALINNDGYWVRTSDYSIYQDAKGRFHILPQDSNETFARPGGPGFGGGRGGPGGGRGGFGPAMMVAGQMLSQADQNGDQKLSKSEFAALADAWFDKLDADKTGKLSQEQFAGKLAEILPPPQGFGPPDGGPGPEGPGGPGRGRGGFGPAMFIGPGLFAATDVNKDGSLTRAEFKDTFAKWIVEWDAEKSGSLTEEKLRTGLSIVLPQPNFGGPGGGFAGPGGGRGRGGPGFSNMPRVEGVKLDPLVAANDANKPLLSKLLAVPSLRALYLGYVRDIAEKWLDWNKLGPIAHQYHALIAPDVKADTRKLESLEDFERSLTSDTQGGGFGGPGGGRISLKAFADQRRAYLLNYSEPKTAAK